MRRTDDELLYPVAGLLGDVAGSTRDHHVGPTTVDLGEDIALAAPVEGELHLARTNRGLLVRARLATAIAAACSRCLRSIDVPLELTIDDEALPSVELTTGEPLDTALADTSSFRQSLAALKPGKTTVTLWVYQDSFAEFRQLRKELYRLGFVTAGRPLTDTMPIGGSPDGSRSAAE